MDNFGMDSGDTATAITDTQSKTMGPQTEKREVDRLME